MENINPFRLSDREMEQKAADIRCQVVKMIYESGGGHIGGALSTVDLLTALFYGVLNYRAEDPRWDGRDHFILSKGHSCEGYYCILADCGFFDKKHLAAFQKYDALLAGHPHPKVPGVEMATGSLGHGLAIAVGMALARKMDQKSNQVYCLAGDGELAEGSVWEAAMAAAHYRLDNLICLIDRNGLQISGPTENVMKLEGLRDRWAAFGWEIHEIDGHNLPEIKKMLLKAPFVAGKPSLIIAHTVKGKGISFMEGNYQWHHRVPKENEYSQAIQEIQAKFN